MSTKKKSTVKPAAKPVEESVAPAAESIEQPVAAAPERVEVPAAASARGYDAFTAFHKENVEALVQVGSILTQGAEEFGNAFFAYAQSAATANAEAVTAMLGAKSLKQATDLHNEYAKSVLDTSVAETTKLYEISLKVAEETAQPLQSHFTAAMAKSLKPAFV